MIDFLNLIWPWVVGWLVIGLMVSLTTALLGGQNFHKSIRLFSIVGWPLLFLVGIILVLLWLLTNIKGIFK